MRCDVQRGSSLIEVLVAILIVSVGVLALAGLLGVSGRLAKTSEFRATASLLAADIADRMRANRVGADAGSYGLATAALAGSDTAAAPACANPATCTMAELAAQDLAEWKARLYKGLPSGTGHIAYMSNSGVADVWVIWSDPSATTAAADSDNALINADLPARRCPPAFASDAASCMFFRVGL